MLDTVVERLRDLAFKGPSPSDVRTSVALPQSRLRMRSAVVKHWSFIIVQPGDTSPNRHRRKFVYLLLEGNIEGPAVAIDFRTLRFEFRARLRWVTNSIEISAMFIL
jgi:hypothetical protein